MSLPTVTDWYNLLRKGVSAIEDLTEATNKALAFRQELAAEIPPAGKPEPEEAPAAEAPKRGRPRVVVKTEKEKAPEPEPEEEEEEEEEPKEEEAFDTDAIPTNQQITDAVQDYYARAKEADPDPANNKAAKAAFGALREKYKVATVKELPEDETRVKFMADIAKLPLKG